jgi:hypothetical protein
VLLRTTERPAAIGADPVFPAIGKPARLDTHFHVHAEAVQ